MSTEQSQRYVHEAVYYESTRQLVDDTAPWLRRALVQGEDVALVCSDVNNRALTEALGEDDRILVLPRREIFQRAISAAAYYRDFMRERLELGSTGVRLLAEVDFGSDSRAWDEWRRFEALCNHALTPFPLWTLCAYNTRSLPDPILVTGELTHPYLRRDGCREENPAYVDPAELLRLADTDTGLIPDLEPAATIEEVSDLAELHDELRALLAAERLSGERAEDLIIAVHELATNGLRHGTPPVTVRVWLSTGRVVCTVTDHGRGFDDPFAGYTTGGGQALPEGPFGLWLARQLCDELVTTRTPEGFTARLVLRH